MKRLERVYFIGVGGIGMSAIARYMISRNIKVFGYDKTETELTKKLVEEGIEIYYEDDVRLIPKGIDLVVYTPAIPKDHKGLNYFLENGFDVIKRAEMLGRLSKVKKTIAIAGTHGKTSTSATTAHLLTHGNKEISAFIGGIMTNYNSNYLEGSGDWIVVEADEYDRSFLHLTPEILAVMSMDADHLDIYGDQDKMQESFEAFIRNVKDKGLVLLKSGLKEGLSAKLIVDLKERGVVISEFAIEAEADIVASKVQVADGNFHFSYKDEAVEIPDLISRLPGRHNIENAMVAIRIGRAMGLNVEQLREGMHRFKGIQRRFQKIHEGEDIVFIDDYAHHPTELKSAIAAARELYPNRRITGVFQPHLYSRTRDFAEGFAEALEALDEVVLMEIYPAREQPIPGVTSQIIFDRLQKKEKQLVTKASLMETIKKMNIDVLLTLGAGDIDMFVPRIKKYLETKSSID